jgi:hypothetical protein
LVQGGEVPDFEARVFLGRRRKPRHGRRFRISPSEIDKLKYGDAGTRGIYLIRDVNRQLPKRAGESPDGKILRIPCNCNKRMYGYYPVYSVAPAMLDNAWYAPEQEPRLVILPEFLEVLEYSRHRKLRNARFGG